MVKYKVSATRMPNKTNKTWICCSCGYLHKLIKMDPITGKSHSEVGLVMSDLLNNFKGMNYVAYTFLQMHQ